VESTKEVRRPLTQKGIDADLPQPALPPPERPAPPSDCIVVQYGADGRLAVTINRSASRSSRAGSPPSSATAGTRRCSWWGTARFPTAASSRWSTWRTAPACSRSASSPRACAG